MLPALSQVAEEREAGSGEPIVALAGIAAGDLDRDERAVQELAQGSRDRGRRTLPTTGEHRGHEVLPLDLLEDPPLHLGEPDLARELEPALPKELREPL